MRIEEERTGNVRGEDTAGVEGEFDVSKLWGDPEGEGGEFDGEFEVLRV